jgi:hypothetical protein
MVRTGAQSYIKYGYESTYGGSATTDKKFGLNDRLSSWSLTHNRIDLPALNQVTYESYAYGQQAGEIGVDFVLSNPWILGAFFGAPSTTGSSNPYTHTYPHASNGINKQPRSFQMEVGFNAADTSNSDVVRTLKGCVASTLGISTSIGATVDCSLSASYGKEDAPATTFGSAPSEPTLNHGAFTFAHAQLTYGGSVLAQVQDLNLSINQTTSLLYGLNSQQAVDSYRQILDITGSFKASLLNKNILEDVLEQALKGTSGTFSETVGGSPELEILFRKNANEEIKITGTGLSPTSLSVEGIAPNEPVFENIDWRVKSVTVACKNSQTAEE